MRGMPTANRTRRTAERILIQIDWLSEFAPREASIVRSSDAGQPGCSLDARVLPRRPDPRSLGRKELGWTAGWRPTPGNKRNATPARWRRSPAWPYPDPP